MEEDGEELFTKLASPSNSALGTDLEPRERGITIRQKTSHESTPKYTAKT
jgi:hypothetical protein